MLEIAQQMIICLLLAALIGAIIGYILGKSSCSDDCGHTTDAEEEKTPDAHTLVSTNTVAPEITSEQGHADNKPILLTEPREGGKDNLTRIKGIGVKIEEQLNDIGIYHFDQIASWDADNIAWADSTLGFPGRAKREQWVEQAATLAAGEETEFSQRVDKGEVSSSKKA